MVVALEKPAVNGENCFCISEIFYVIALSYIWNNGRLFIIISYNEKIVNNIIHHIFILNCENCSIYHLVNI